jgi:acyl carrier protein
MVVLIEDQFNIKIPDHLLLMDKLKSVGDIVTIIKNERTAYAQEKEVLVNV